MAQTRDVCIQGGTVVTASEIYPADVWIRDGKIMTVGEQISPPSQEYEVIDASGKYVFPGGIDPHTHLESHWDGVVTADDWVTGTVAAAAGGTTTIIDFCRQTRGDSLRDVLDIWHKRSKGRAVVDYSYHLVISDLNDAVLEEMEHAVYQEGITSFKIFMAYKDSLQIDDSVIYRTLRKARELGAVVLAHCENGDIIETLIHEAIQQGNTSPIYHAYTRPPELEAEAAGRLLHIANLLGTPIYITHVTSGLVLEQIEMARGRGQTVYAETCPQYLVLDIDCLNKPDFEGAKYVVSPSLREKHHQQAVWEGIYSGKFQTLGSDHSSYNFAGQKELGRNSFKDIPNGLPTIEDRMSILYHFGVAAGQISLNEFVSLTSTGAAKTFGLYPQKGTIAPGSDADLVIWDPAAERTISARTHHMNVDYSAFEGFRVKGAPIRTILRGQTIIDNGTYVGSPGTGKFLKRAANSDEQKGAASP